MNKHKKYFYNFLVALGISFVMLIGSSLFIILKIKNPHPNTYTTAYLDKINLLEMTQGEKRIIFIGGSNLAFGLNSEKIKEKFSEYEVINTSVHAGIGLRYILNDTKQYLGNEDIVIIAPEYSHFYTGGFGDYALWEVISAKKELKNLEIFNFIKSLPTLINGMKSIILTKENQDFGKKFTYDRRGFNKYGDYSEHWNYESRSSIPESIIGEKKSNEGFIKYFQEFKNDLERKGIKYLILPPVITETSFQLNSKKIENIEIRKEVGF